MSEHFFRYTPSAAIKVNSVSDLVDGIGFVTTPATIAANTPFRIKIQLPQVVPLNLIPVVAANQFPSSLFLQAIVYDAAAFDNATITQATKMLVGTPTHSPQRNRKALRLLPKQVFRFKGRVVGTGKAMIVVRSLHAFYDDGAVAYPDRKPIVKFVGPITVA